MHTKYSGATLQLGKRGCEKRRLRNENGGRNERKGVFLETPRRPCFNFIYIRFLCNTSHPRFDLCGYPTMFGGRKNKKKESAVKDDSAKAHLLFKKYTNKEEGDDLDGQSFRIGQEGIGLLCDDISLDPEDIRVLVLLWRLGANTK